MRITRQKLIELAAQEAQRRAESGGLISAYLIGTVAQGDPLLGETADIDIVFIHKEPPTCEREIVRLSQQVHFDIAHHHKQRYEKPSLLRTDPWLGPALCEPIFLHDPEHFFEWAQAGARGQYYRPDHAFARASAFLEQARQQSSLLQISERWERAYLSAMLDASNSVASLHKFPVAGRRLALALKHQSQALELPDVYNGFMHMIGAELIHDWAVTDLFQPWAQAFDAASKLDHEELLVECRRDYYLQGFQALTESGEHKAVLWPLLLTWERSIFSLDRLMDPSYHRQAWDKTLADLQLDPSRRVERERALAHFIDHAQSQLELWAEEHGA